MKNVFGLLSFIMIASVARAHESNLDKLTYGVTSNKELSKLIKTFERSRKFKCNRLSDENVVIKDDELGIWQPFTAVVSCGPRINTIEFIGLVAAQTASSESVIQSVSVDSKE